MLVNNEASPIGILEAKWNNNQHCNNNYKKCRPDLMFNYWQTKNAIGKGKINYHLLLKSIPFIT